MRQSGTELEQLTLYWTIPENSCKKDIFHREVARVGHFCLVSDNVYHLAWDDRTSSQTVVWVEISKRPRVKSNFPSSKSLRLEVRAQPLGTNNVFLSRVPNFIPPGVNVEHRVVIHEEHPRTRVVTMFLIKRLQQYWVSHHCLSSSPLFLTCLDQSMTVKVRHENMTNLHMRESRIELEQLTHPV